MQPLSPPGWRFIDDQGTFELEAPQENNYLYFPLVNQAGMISSLTPTFNGDAKIGQNAYLLLPVSVEDLHTSRAGRNFWVRVNGVPWSVTGNSAAQMAHSLSADPETVALRAGLLWQTVTRQHPDLGLRAEVTAFVPAGEDCVELMRVALTNCGEGALTLTPTAAIPIFGRSADNLRDHRHVTSLLHRTTCHRHGVLVRPTLSFDERGHAPNQLTYAVLGADGDGRPPAGFFPLVQDFIGEGGTLDWPRAVVAGLPAEQAEGPVEPGYESIGAIRFADLTLQPGQTARYVLLLAILPDPPEVDALLSRYGSAERFEERLAETRIRWSEKLAGLHFSTGEARFDGWLQWVTLQPALRRLIGNSFLPYHDYGRGGRGWRDLWQDALALLLTEGEVVAPLLLDSFAGVRPDGSNATIIGNQPGEFRADRNGIPRVWMDHGAWPLLTVKLYLDLSGDLDFLLREQAYFKDHLSHRCRQIDPLWTPEQGTRLRTAAGELATGTVLEHLLIQHLTAFYNVGSHNTLLLEGADWNDGLDMAAEKGESVAFSALYAANLRTLGELCLALVGRGVRDTLLAEEVLPLLDLNTGPVDVASVEAKQGRLQAYFDLVGHALSGEKQRVLLADLALDLLAKADWLREHIRQQEWVTDQEGFGWFNGYYNNVGQRVEGKFFGRVRMTLTGQVFTLMGGVATDQQAQDIALAVDHYLYDESLQGYRLNTDFGEGLLNLGRAFGFAFGHKENGAMFSHMAAMYANALYRRGLVREGWKVLEGIYQHSQDFARSRMYPGIPEYFNARGRGMYPYLTGAAAWYLLTLLTEVYGVKGQLGDLVLEPGFAPGQFALADRLEVRTIFAGKRLEIAYLNPGRLSSGDYRFVSASVNDRPLEIELGAARVIIPRREIEAWPDHTRIVIQFDRKR
ncbi:MAG: cellobiose phosphorylase [Anaerolineales bacterium]|nr:cellobiose phosphorylase [Anaerolineales bacterium]